MAEIAHDEPVLAAPRRRGRPRRLSREAVINAAISLLSEVGLEGFSLAPLAKRLEAGVMSLYTYFPNRELLLLAVADAIYARFEPPAPGAAWQDQLRGWMWAVVDLFDRHPVAVQLSMWNGHVSPAWLRTWAPLATLLRQQKLEGQRLAFALSWFTTATLGFISSQRQSPENRRAETLAHAATLEPSLQQLASELWADFESVDRDAALTFGFDNIINGMERLIRSDQVPLPSRSGRWSVSERAAAAGPKIEGD
ncbi:TetR/AcrR family transcriptional regulator C-terminal domain-containing protein [Sphingobium sp. EP60837]|uniref:TetR/AcrR family transcriptional regulator C-terminal domain-containing protein n=1 Tax=Sphingobium sp. EP60837 TaxID=1855519 RepID=UPI0007DD6D47|nr:TetR/AcrR family transcriptional regulator C-terminal domain-containing protein [Sphingobium sp. EP60837]ANI77165.1 Tetracycline repressor protein class C [Sphingobium sp. EP60837]